MIAVDARGGEKVICPATVPFGESLDLFRKYEREGKLPSGAVQLIWQASDSPAKVIKVKPAPVADNKKEDK